MKPFGIWSPNHKVGFLIPKYPKGLCVWMLECLLSIIRWMLLHKFIKGSEAMPAILKIRGSIERIDNANSGHTP
jgi:hypothetical protein